MRDRRDRLVADTLRLRRLVGAAAARGGERLAAAAGRLEAGSPLHLLARGWSVTSLANGPREAVRSVAGLVPGTLLITQLADGRVRSTVLDTDRTAAASGTVDTSRSGKDGPG